MVTMLLEVTGVVYTNDEHLKTHCRPHLDVQFAWIPDNGQKHENLSPKVRKSRFYLTIYTDSTGGWIGAQCGGGLGPIRVPRPIRRCRGTRCLRPIICANLEGRGHCHGVGVPGSAAPHRVFS